MHSTFFRQALNILSLLLLTFITVCSGKEDNTCLTSDTEDNTWSTSNNVNLHENDISPSELNSPGCCTPIHYPELTMNPLDHITGLLQQMAEEAPEHKNFITNELFQKTHPINHEDINSGFEILLPKHPVLLHLTIHYLVLTRPLEAPELINFSISPHDIGLILEHTESDLGKKYLLRLTKTISNKKIYDIFLATTLLDKSFDFLHQDIPYIIELNSRLTHIAQLVAIDLTKRFTVQNFEKRRPFLGDFNIFDYDVMLIIYSYLDISVNASQQVIINPPRDVVTEINKIDNISRIRPKTLDFNGSDDELDHPRTPPFLRLQ